MARPPCCDKLNLKRGLWTAEEDAKILAYVSRHGTGNWTTVPKKAGLRRCGKSCRLRWTNYLRPHLKHDNFTPQEEELIVRLHAAIGSRWSIIAQQLPGRTDNDVKNYWNTKLRKKLSEMGIDPVTHKPVSQLLTDYGNIGGFLKGGPRFGSLNRDLKNAFMLKSGQSSVPPQGFSDINSHLIKSTILPKVEPIQACFFNNSNNNNKNNNNKHFYQHNADDHSLDLLAEFQTIALVREASASKCTKHEPITPHFLNESSSIPSPSSSLSSTCSTAAQAKLPLGFSWHDFLLEDAFLPGDSQEWESMTEFSSKGSSAKAQTAKAHIEGEQSLDEVRKMDYGVQTNGLQASSSSNSSFVEAILDHDNEMFMQFPDLFEEPLYY